MSSAGFYDFDGNPITALQWSALFEDLAGRTLAEDYVGARGIKTVWLGHVVPSVDTLRLYGSALVNNGQYVKELACYDNRAEALAGHARLVEALRMEETD